MLCYLSLLSIFLSRSVPSRSVACTTLAPRSHSKQQQFIFPLADGFAYTRRGGEASTRKHTTKEHTTSKHSCTPSQGKQHTRQSYVRCPFCGILGGRFVHQSRVDLFLFLCAPPSPRSSTRLMMDSRFVHLGSCCNGDGRDFVPINILFSRLIARSPSLSTAPTISLAHTHTLN